MKRMLLLGLFVLVVISHSACNSLKQEEISSSASQSTISELSVSEDSKNEPFKEITKASDIVGLPSKIVLATNGGEKEFLPSSAQFHTILEITNARFPDGLGETACAFDWWNDDFSKIDWSKMADDFGYLRFVYADEQKIRLNCFRDGYEDYTPELSYQDIIFPLTGNLKELFFIGTTKSFGPLDQTQNTLDQLLEM